MAQLKSTNITGNLAVTGTVVANDIKNGEGKTIILPSYSEDNNNQFLRVVGGVVQWSVVPRAEDNTF